MYLLSLPILLPAFYFIWKTITYWVKLREKQLKYSRAKAALAWIVITILLALVLVFYEYSILKSNHKESYLINSIIYYLSIDLLLFLAHYFISLSNSMRNILKLNFILLILILFIPAIQWNRQVLKSGIYNGKIGTSQYLASEIVSEEIGNRINHQIIDRKDEGSQWQVEAVLYSRDSGTEIKKNYLVDKKTRGIIKNPNEKKVSIDLIKASNSSDEIEIYLIKGNALPIDSASSWKASDYQISDTNGKAEFSVSAESAQDYKLQIHDCTVKCVDYYYILKSPTKDNYKIDLDAMQSGVVEL